MKIKIIFFFILGLDVLILFFQSSEISISYQETLILYGTITPLQILIKLSMYLFGHNDFSLRLPMILAHLLSASLLFDISNKYMNDRNRLWLVIIFILLPGVLSSALLLNKAGLIIFGLLLFVWMYQKGNKMSYYFLLTSFIFLDNIFIYLFLALSIYAIYINNRWFFIFNMVAFFISIFSFGLDAHGLPTGHFLDVLGLYAAIFSPIIFLYIVFALYRKYLSQEIDILWFISSIPFIISLFLSFRQTIPVEHFAPFLIISLPLVAQVFISSYRVRLKMFRGKYRMIFIISFVFLVFNTLIVIFNKELYRLIDNPTKHFVYKFHIAKELAQKLKKNSIDCVTTDYRMQQRLYFYGVTKCDKYRLNKIKPMEIEDINVTISYRNTPVFVSYVTKVNN